MASKNKEAMTARAFILPKTLIRKLALAAHSQAIVPHSASAANRALIEISHAPLARSCVSLERPLVRQMRSVSHKSVLAFWNKMSYNI
jgi:hypothetical protein